MTVLGELRQVLRTLRRSPGFTAVAVLTLALGIGANTAIFSVLDAVLLRPLPYRNSDALVALGTRFLKEGRAIPRVTGGDLADLRDQGRVFDAFSYYTGGEIGVQVRGKAEFAGAQLVNAGFFRVFGIVPVAGRLFADSEDWRSAVVSASFARRHFGTPELAVGQSLEIEKRPIEITGVAPDTLQFPQDTAVWLAAPFRPESLERTAYNYQAVARLKPGVTLAAARSEVERVGATLASTYPASNRDKTFALEPLRDRIAGSMRGTLGLLMGAVALVLLIACTNVANLLLARGTARSHEIAVRAALGAGRARVVRLLLIESLVLGIAGGMLGLVIAYWGAQALVRLAPAGLPRVAGSAIDGTVLAFTVAVSLAASLLFGLAPAWSASRVQWSSALKQGGSRGLAGGTRGHLRHALVVAEIAAALVLATAAGLLARSLVALGNVPLGFRAGRMLVMYAHAPANTLPEYLRAGRDFERIFAELQLLPGVRSVAGAMGLPAGRYSSDGAYAVEGKHRFAPGENLPHAGFRLASPGYFAAMGIPLARGREFSAADQYDTPFTAIISRSLAAESFPNEDPIGRRIQCGLDSDKWMTVVGVVGDVRQTPGQAPAPELYMPLTQHPYHANELQVILRTTGSPAALETTVRRKMQEVAPGVPVQLTTLEEMLSGSVAAPRFRAFLVGSFAALAMLLAMAGVYGVMTYTVAQRTSELGLRVALGACTSDIFRAVMGRVAALTGLGLAIGAAGSLAAARALESMLFEVRPADPLTHAVVVAVVAAVALAAAAVPAWRATRIDPITALRGD